MVAFKDRFVKFSNTSVFFLCVCVYTTFLVPIEEGRRGCQIPWNWGYDACKPPFRHWLANFSPLQELPVLLTTGLILQSFNCASVLINFKTLLQDLLRAEEVGTLGISEEVNVRCGALSVTLAIWLCVFAASLCSAELLKDMDISGPHSHLELTWITPPLFYRPKPVVILLETSIGFDASSGSRHGSANSKKLTSVCSLFASFHPLLPVVHTWALWAFESLFRCTK